MRGSRRDEDVTVRNRYPWSERILSVLTSVNSLCKKSIERGSGYALESGFSREKTHRCTRKVSAAYWESEKGVVRTRYLAKSMETYRYHDAKLQPKIRLFRQLTSIPIDR